MDDTSITHAMQHIMMKFAHQSFSPTGHEKYITYTIYSSIESQAEKISDLCLTKCFSELIFFCFRFASLCGIRLEANHFLRILRITHPLEA